MDEFKALIRQEIEVVVSFRKLVKALFWVVALVTVLVLALEIQVWQRNNRLDELEGSVRKIRAVAESVQSEPAVEQAQRTQKALDQIDKICRVVRCDQGEGR